MKRILKVYEMPGCASRDIPSIRIQGKWLEKLGYQPGQRIIVREEANRLIIEKSDRKDPEERANG